MAEKRTQQRKRNRNFTKVFDIDTGRCVGRLVNITTGGMMLMTESPFERDATFNFRIVLPRMFDDMLDIEVKAVARWCKRDANPDFWGAGFQFIQIGAEETRVIECVFEGFAPVR